MRRKQDRHPRREAVPTPSPIELGAALNMGSRLHGSREVRIGGDRASKPPENQDRRRRSAACSGIPGTQLAPTSAHVRGRATKMHEGRIGQSGKGAAGGRGCAA